MKIISRKEAAALRLSRYFTGKPCKHGHISERHTTNSDCMECVKSRAQNKQQSEYNDIDTELTFQELRAIITSMKSGHFRFMEKRKPNLLAEIIRHTKFLDHRKPLMPERLYCIRHEIHSPKLCEYCQCAEVSFNTKHPPYNTYQRFCSAKCAANHDSVQERKKSTSRKRYGTDYPAQAEIVKDKCRSTNMDRYGMPSVLCDVKMRKEKMLEKYGVEYAMQHTDLGEAATQKRNAKMDDIMEKVKHTNMERYGVEWFYQSDYFKSLPHDWKSSKGEREVADWIESLGLSINRNDQTTVGVELDIYIPEKKLAIEYCGLHWHCEWFKERNAHKDKYDLCRENNIHLITLFEDEWRKQNVQPIVKERLSMLLGVHAGSTRYARKLDIRPLTFASCKDFFEREHLQGAVYFSVGYGLYDGDDLVAAMTWARRNNEVYELNRFAANGLVIGAFSRLLKAFERNHEFREIVSFADCRWSLGDVYYQHGFVLERVIRPDYYYVKNMERFHKFLFRKNRIKSRFNIDITGKTERMLTEELGYKRIYDCGKLKLVKRLDGLVAAE